MNSILITGSATGIGRVLVDEFLAKGWLVYATMRRLEERKNLFEDAAKLYPTQLKLLELDVCEPAAQDRVAQIFAAGSLDILINNAGYALFGPLETLSDEQVNKQILTNITAPMMLTRRLLPALRRGKGAVINISSVMSFVGFPLSSAYCASKAALTSFSEALYHELSPHGVKVYAVEPGGYRTDFGNNIQWGARQAPEYLTQLSGYQALRNRLSAGKGRPPQEVTNLVLKLAEDRPFAIRHRVGADSVVSGWLIKWVPENPRMWILGKFFRKIIGGQTS
ncbi:MAG: SDR family oxidoreductase [Myxococcota bacterium]|nr:SDR family oxidoreductase [Myxococcota bacterium]